MDKDFLKWHKDFVKRFANNGDAAKYDTAGDYHPKDMDEWLGLVDKNHTKIREKLGGTSKTFKIGIKDAEPTRAPYQSVHDIMSEVIRIMPQYFYTYYLYYECFQQPKLTAYKNISGTKHILGYADRIKLEADKRKELEKLTERLGQLWAQTCKAPKSEGYITITTDPKAFCVLGRLTTDGYSCFGQGNFNSDKKYALAIHNDSFVVLAHENEQLKLEDEKDNNVVARALGVMTKKMSVMNTLNHHPHYYKGSLKANQTQMVEVAQQFFETKAVDVQVDKLCLTHGINYGSYSGFSFYDKDKAKPLGNVQQIKIDPRYSKEAHPNGDRYGKWDGMPTPEETENY